MYLRIMFEGNGTRPYTEFDAPNPVSAYGKTKLEGENFVKEFAKKHFILRTAWLYGDGKNFVKTMLALAENHDELNVVCDQVGNTYQRSGISKNDSLSGRHRELWNLPCNL